jgi:hypothetical protein
MACSAIDSERLGWRDQKGILDVGQVSIDGYRVDAVTEVSPVISQTGDYL